ncbi:MAG: hypothetical protein KC729_17395, partial [Candidatus Eisenbacteria bacterium]|nr:hypothetical protein [Candidatus Eisenbacteria bacterium]
MVVRIVLLALVPLFLASSSSLAKKLEPNLVAAASRFGVDLDAPSSSLRHAQRGGGADTVSYGDIGPDGFSIFGDVWDWDDPDQPGDPLMGWYATDNSVAAGVFGRRVDASIWDGHDNTVDAPILTGNGSLWIGAFEDEADGLCYEAGLGYGSYWCQQILSPVVTLVSSADINLSFRYFNGTELNFDYTRVLLRTIPAGDEIVLGPPDGFTGPIGLASDSPLHPPVGQTFDTGIPTSALNGATQFQLVFQMTSDGGWDDEDGDYGTDFGAFGLDDVAMSGGASLTADFETDEEGWGFEACPGVGTYFGVGNLASYQIADLCGCGLSGNLLEFHDDSREHPRGQWMSARSNPTDVQDMVARLGASPNQLAIIGEWDQYSDMPRNNGVFYRPGWDYYPYECPVSGTIGWSGRVGPNTFFYNAGPSCSRLRQSQTGGFLPAGTEQVRFVYEIYSSCDAFGIPPTECGSTNFTPLVDNVRVRGTKVPAAPPIQFSPDPVGSRFQDAFIPSLLLDPNGRGNADVSANAAGYPGNQPPIVPGDSLYVRGPVPTPSTRWEARLWFRVRREGPGIKVARYLDWKSDVAAINGNPDPTVGFAYAWMDSFQTATTVSRNAFVSYCREDNWYPGEIGEFSEGNEIIRDDVLVAGSAVDYFVTANYVTTPAESFYLPDTTGGYFFEFEILPGWRHEAGHDRYPCLLYVDTNSGAERYVESALDALGLDHDRYDYNDATSNWKCPLARAPGSTNGVPVIQLIGYRSILVNTGGLDAAMWPEDYELFEDWLTYIRSCGRQALLLNGDNLAAT